MSSQRTRCCSAVEGGSDIATGVGATLGSMGRTCSPVMREDVTLERSFGKTAGASFQKALTDRPRRDRAPGRGGRPVRGRRARIRGNLASSAADVFTAGDIAE
jgi:hypothetical protein